MVGSVVEDVVKVITENDFSHGAEFDAAPYYLLSPFYEFQVSPFDHAISTSQSLQPCLLIQHSLLACQCCLSRVYPLTQARTFTFSYVVYALHAWCRTWYIVRWLVM